jgi:hypothetical protein
VEELLKRYRGQRCPALFAVSGTARTFAEMAQDRIKKRDDRVVGLIKFSWGGVTGEIVSEVFALTSGELEHADGIGKIPPIIDCTGKIATGSLFSGLRSHLELL